MPSQPGSSESRTPEGADGNGSPVLVRPIRAEDDAAMAAVIRVVMTSFGAVGDGFSIQDAEVDRMSEAYSLPGTAYWVALRSDGTLLGGAGIGPLPGTGPDTCELKKMYVLEEGRGLGLGRRLLELCLRGAVDRGYRRCYLETLSSMHRAQQLYRKAGFVPIPRPMGATGHFGCDRWYLLELEEAEA